MNRSTFIGSIAIVAVISLSTQCYSSPDSHFGQESNQQDGLDAAKSAVCIVWLKTKNRQFAASGFLHYRDDEFVYVMYHARKEIKNVESFSVSLRDASGSKVEFEASQYISIDPDGSGVVRFRNKQAHDTVLHLQPAEAIDGQKVRLVGFKVVGEEPSDSVVAFEYEGVLSKDDHTGDLTVESSEFRSADRAIAVAETGELVGTVDFQTLPDSTRRRVFQTSPAFLSNLAGQLIHPKCRLTEQNDTEYIFTVDGSFTNHRKVIAKDFLFYFCEGKKDEDKATLFL